MPLQGAGAMLSLARKSGRRLRGCEQPECAGCRMNAESTGAIVARHAARQRQSVTLLGWARKIRFFRWLAGSAGVSGRAPYGHGIKIAGPNHRVIAYVPILVPEDNPCSSPVAASPRNSPKQILNAAARCEAMVVSTQSRRGRRYPHWDLKPGGGMSALYALRRGTRGLGGGV